ncbi:Nif3-like dinuclear metal center hexameric protein [Granulicella sp. dw_53]|uniref:Nif3-like dinuclear metal center hexameric protein n=1 Tax=Granulicella sp. dw_53 TaxID=2719792 RepID=UPI001BD6BA71|nr:Nif3-like dinuclear metal center hexameric protein [Granulicella sp. dw_53]
MTDLSRRNFIVAGGAFLSTVSSGAQSAAASLTAGDVIARIKRDIGVPWREKTVDNLLTGSTDTPVHGIATTMMATLDVVERCVAAGKNMILSHETPFYLHQDNIDDIKNDSVLQYKLEYCKKNDVAIFHFHDHWHARHPDGIAQGMVNQLGWQKNVSDPANPKKLVFDGVSLAKLTQEMQSTLKAHTLRVLGDPDLRVRRVETSWGYCGREGGIGIFSRPDVDVLICGETREWELVEYCQDSIKAGNKKALVVVGHVLSEQGGMILCRDWLKPIVPEVSIEFIPAMEPFWIPNQPVRA